MAHKMTDDQWRAFVSTGTRTAKLSTVRADGRPHIAPVWFVLDGDDLVFNTGKSTVKGRNLARDPRASICVDEEQPPFAFVVCEGRVTLSEEPGALLESAIRIGTRYMGPEQGEAFGRRNGVPGELLVRLHVDNVVALADLTG